MGGPPSPTLITLGRLVRVYRDRAGLLQKDLANRIGYSDAWLSNLETGQLIRPRREQIIALEKELKVDSPGVLVTVFDQLDNETLPSWFRSWLDEERRADVLRWFEMALVPGLLQTEGYARVMLQDDEQAVAARMKRQEILRRDSPPEVHCVIDEAVFYQERGGREVMHEQLLHLADSVAPPNLTIQVVLSSMNPRSVGAFTIATIADEEVAYVETAMRGLVTNNREDIRTLSRAWESIRTYALTQPDSITFIRKVAEEKWA